MSMVLSHRTALELYRSSMMPVSGYEKVSFLSLSVPTRNDVECYRAYTASLRCAQAKEP